MAIDERSIMSKLNAYAKTSAGKKKMEAKIQSYRNGSDPGVRSSGRTYGGGVIVTEREMMDAATELVSMLRSAAASVNLPVSIMEHIESFRVLPPKIEPDGSATVEIYMADSPARASLYPEKYDYVDNIVAIFNNGYTAKNKVYGKWHGVNVSSLDKRQGLFFMQKAVDAFIDKYGSKLNVTVSLDPIYNGAW